MTTAETLRDLGRRTKDAARRGRETEVEILIRSAQNIARGTTARDASLMEETFWAAYHGKREL